jgi:hypothetical protein
MKKRQYSLFFALAFVTQIGLTQDPVLPPANYGLANMTDGFTPGPGLYFFTHLQVFKSKSLRDSYGEKVATDMKLSSLVSLNQLVWLTKINVLRGNLAFTAILPIVKINLNSAAGAVLSINPGTRGDLVLGTAVQWLDKQLLRKSLYHRSEITVSLPVGSNDSRYNVNQSAQLYTITLNHAYTHFLSKSWSMSARNHFSYNTHLRNTKIRPGFFYNVNYSFERTIYKSLRAEIAGYFLQQLEEDAYNGDHRHYQKMYGVKSTKEKVLAIGPGISYVTPTGLFIEVKSFYEVKAQNRFKGVRPSFRLAYQLMK